MEHDKEWSNHLNINSVLYYLGHSLAISLILTFITYFVLSKMSEYKTSPKKRNQLKLGSANIFFICLGLTVMMLLVGENLALAFALGGTLKLIQLRASLGPKKLTTNLFFAIIAGIACGVESIEIAWIITAFYIVLQFSLLALTSKEVEE